MYSMKKGGSTGPKKKGGMAAYEKSSYDKKMDSKGAHGGEGSKKDMAFDKKAASKMGYMKKGGSVKGKTPMTSSQKKFASLAAPKDKITFADKIAGAKKKK